MSKEPADPDLNLGSVMRSDGFRVVAGVLAPDLVERSAAALDQVFDQEADVAPERGWLTDAYRVSYALPAKHVAFLELCTHPGLLGLARSALGPDAVLSGFNGLAMIPGGTGQALHRDHPDASPGTTTGLHLVCALDPFTQATGATRFVPRSHHRPGRWRPDDDERIELEKRVEVVRADAGGVVAFDAAVLHGAGPNTTDRSRRALHVFFRRPWVQPHWDLPASLPVEVVRGLTVAQRAVLGFDVSPARFDPGERRVIRTFRDRGEASR